MKKISSSLVKVLPKSTLYFTWLLLFGVATFMLGFGFAPWDSVPIEIMSISPPEWELRLSSFIENGGSALIAAIPVALSIYFISKKNRSRPYLLLVISNLMFILSFFLPIHFSHMLNQWFFPTGMYGYVTTIIPLIEFIIHTSLWLNAQVWILNHQEQTKYKAKAKRLSVEHSLLEDQDKDFESYLNNTDTQQLSYNKTK